MRKYVCIICLSLLAFSSARADEGGALIVDVLAKSGVSWDGGRLPEYAKGAPEVTILRIKIPPGAQLPLHKHPVINAGVLVAGELTVVTEENKTLRLKAGDALVEVVNTWHYGKNEGKAMAEILVFYAGTPDLPISIKKADISPENKGESR